MRARLLARGGATLLAGCSLVLVGAEAVPSAKADGIGISSVNNRAADTTAQDSQVAPTVAWAGGPYVFSAWFDSGSNTGTGPSSFHKVGYAHSTDGGKTWTDGGRLPDSTAGDSGNPNAAADTTTGNIYLATDAFSVLSTLPLFRSTDHGHTFGPPINAMPGLGSGDFVLRPWITVDNFPGSGQGDVFACAQHYSSSPPNILFSRSVDGGASFVPSGLPLASDDAFGCRLAVGPQHWLYAFYMRSTVAGGGFSNRIFVRRSTNSGISFGPEIQVAQLQTQTAFGDLAITGGQNFGGVQTNSYPQVAINPSPSNPFLYVIYNDVTSTPGDNSGIFLNYSIDGGATWSDGTQVNPDRLGDHFYPSVTFGGPNQMFVSYYSRSRDPNNLMFHRRGRLATIASGTGVPSFYPSFQLGPDTPMVTGHDPSVSDGYIGEFEQATAMPGAVVSLWSDNRNPDPFHRAQPDIFSAIVPMPIQKADLGIQVTSSQASAALGLDTVVFNVTAGATGGAANDVFVSIPPVIGWNYHYAQPPAGGACWNKQGFIGCAMGAIPNGGSKTAKIGAIGVIGAGTRTLPAYATTSSADVQTNNNNGSSQIQIAPEGTFGHILHSGNVNVTIPDDGQIQIPLVDQTDGITVWASVSVRLDHPRDRDLALSLITPTGRVLPLSTHNGGDGANYGKDAPTCDGIRTIFMDNRPPSPPIRSGAAPFASYYAPEVPMSTILGESGKGTWRLQISDDARGPGSPAQTGKLYCFNVFLYEVVKP